MNDRPEVLVRAVDAGDTYLSWRWLDTPDRCAYAVLARDTVESALAQLDSALLAPRDDETNEQAAQRALSGALTEPTAELRLAQCLTSAVLPDVLRADIAARGGVIRLRLTPSRRLSRVPWELLCLPDGRRLLEVAEIVHEPPAAIHAARSVSPPEWADVAEHPALLIIDPRTPNGAAAHGLGPVLDPGDRGAFRARVLDYVTRGRILADDKYRALDAKFGRGELAAALRVPRSRLFYYGHVSATVAEPGSAALHLGDTRDSSWGMAEPLTRPNLGGTVTRAPSDHRPLAAIDLLLGTLAGDADAHRFYGETTPVPGARLWPMPPRVALIACEGGADYRCAETFGLVIAMADAGASLITTTRWILPANRAFTTCYPGTDARPASDLGLRVDAAHESADPIGELGAWQREQLDRWRATGDIAASPLVWASLSHTVASARR
ncbi:hypothetical protein [Nocardia salmonicida]|uniref:hypothetical protein n=1 Tax=Nocardia salmonicida TaxID=53431 RepID=UPI003CF6ACAB